MALPNFFCVGTQKAATTTLHDILKQHPDIYLPESKEAWFFHRDGKYRKGLAWYENEYFGSHVNEKAVGEITPEYMYFEKVPGRIFRDLGPNIKFIFILRNPVDRAYSHYLMTYRRGLETQPFNRAIELEELRIRSGFRERVHYSYISRGFYCMQIKRYLKYFTKENMLFLIFEKDMAKNIELTIEKVLMFLDVKVEKMRCDIRSNPASEPKIHFVRDLIYRPNIYKKMLRFMIPSSNMRSGIRKWLDTLNQRPSQMSILDENVRRQVLAKYFIEDIRQLERVIQRDLSIWYIS